MPNSLDTLADERAQLAELETRLLNEYGPEQRDTVHTALKEERRRFAGARVHAFVPILVERSVRSRLADEAD
jgi:hypothetical protein